MHNLSYHVNTVFMSSSIAAGDASSAVNSSGLDMRGYEGVRFLVAVESTSTGVCGVHVEMSATSSFASAIEVDDSAAWMTTGFTTGQAKCLLITDVFRPQYRWVRYVVDRATTGESIAWSIAEQYRPNQMPTSHSTANNVADVKVVVGTSGTATG